MFLYRLIDDSSKGHAVQHDAGIELLRQGILEQFGIAVTENDICKGKLGKPYLKGYPHIHFSISHCKGLVICLISSENCGADAERIRSYFPKVAARVFSEKETELINSLGESEKNRCFTLLWTLKEAYGKFTGRGIGDMKNVCFDGNNNLASNVKDCSFRSFAMGEYIISLCGSYEELLFKDGREITTIK